jgi:membrane protease YdiL (CAAX protease family)
MDESRVRDPFAGPVEAPEERSPGHHAVMAVGVGVAGLLVGTVAGLVTGVVLGVGVATLDVLAAADLTAVVIASLAVTELGYGTVAVLYLAGRPPGLRATLGWPPARALVGGLVAAIGLVGIGQGVLTFVPGVGVDDMVAGGAGAVDPVLLLALAVVSVVFVGPAEELLFRGAVYGTLRRGFGPLGSNLGASALFVLAHVGVLSVGLAGLVPLAIVFAGSLLFGYAYERTGTLVVPIAMHAAYDAALFVLASVLL